MERGILPAFVIMLGAVLLTMVMLVSSHLQAPVSAQTNTSHAQFSAKRSAQEAGAPTTFMTGQVEIVIPGGAKISADEAIVNRQTGVVILRGEVRLHLPPSAIRQ